MHAGGHLSFTVFLCLVRFLLSSEENRTDYKRERVLLCIDFFFIKRTGKQLREREGEKGGPHRLIHMIMEEVDEDEKTRSKKREIDRPGG